MEAAVVNLFGDIQVEKETFRAAVCQRCGTKIYPSRLLHAHIERHRAKDRFLEEELRKLQAVMGRMRRR